VVEDDGLGRTSLMLKIENKGDDFKVGYDVKAAGNAIKANLKSEKQTLKTILNEEYGWFKKDTATIQNDAGKSSRFRISWGEKDSSKSPSRQPAQKSKTGTKKIFRIE